MVTVPLRALPEFVAIVNTTLPFPVPLAPDLIVMNDALLTAVHAHVGPLAPTLTVIVSPPPFAFALVGRITKAHGAGAGVVVVVVVDDGVVVELLEHAPANNAAANETLTTAVERRR
jgi:hypothetical protein